VGQLTQLLLKKYYPALQLQFPVVGSQLEQLQGKQVPVDDEKGVVPPGDQLFAAQGGQTETLDKPCPGLQVKHQPKVVSQVAHA
jgi:hypothetical protein